MTDFNLSEKRKELFGEARIKEFPIALIFLRLEKQDKEFIKRLKEEHGIQKIQDNLQKSFKGTFRDALKNGYKMDEHYVIIDWKFFHELLKKPEINTLAGSELAGVEDG